MKPMGWDWKGYVYASLLDQNISLLIPDHLLSFWPVVWAMLKMMADLSAWVPKEELWLKAPSPGQVA